MSCKNCGSKNRIKSGKARGKQRYKCKECNYHYVEGDSREKYSEKDRITALKLYKRGLSLRAIAEILKTNNVTVLHWIRNFGKYIKSKVLSSKGISTKNDIIEIDEMWHYCEKNKENYGFGLLILVPSKESLELKSALVELKH